MCQQFPGYRGSVGVRGGDLLPGLDGGPAWWVGIAAAGDVQPHDVHDRPVRRAERRERTRGYLAKLPSSSRIDELAYRFHAFAFPLWTFAIAAGAVWAEYAWGRFWGWDPKETWSLVTWVVYAGYLHARATAGWRGKRAAVVAIVGLACFWFNFVGINLLVSGLHSYAGI